MPTNESKTPRTDDNTKVCNYVGGTHLYVDTRFAITLELELSTLTEENKKLKEEFDAFKKKIALQRMMAICEKDGHTTTEDGCAFCLQRELEQFRNTVDAQEFDAVRTERDQLKSQLAELQSANENLFKIKQSTVVENVELKKNNKELQADKDKLLLCCDFTADGKPVKKGAILYLFPWDDVNREPMTIKVSDVCHYCWYESVEDNRLAITAAMKGTK